MSKFGTFEITMTQADADFAGLSKFHNVTYQLQIG